MFGEFRTLAAFNTLDIQEILGAFKAEVELTLENEIAGDNEEKVVAALTVALTQVEVAIVALTQIEKSLDAIAAI